MKVAYYEVQLKRLGHFDHSRYDYAYTLKFLIELCNLYNIRYITAYDKNDRPIKVYNNIDEVLKEVKNDKIEIKD